MPYTRRKVDDNQAEIVSALERCGVLVCKLSQLGHGVPDLLCLGRTGLVLLELKTKKGKLTPEQERWFARWPVKVARTAQEALAACLGAVPATETQDGP